MLITDLGDPRTFLLVANLVIKDFTARASQMLRLPDILARFGGEEFVILLPDTGMADARNAAERVWREIETHRNKALPAYTVSLGLSVAPGDRTSRRYRGLDSRGGCGALPGKAGRAESGRGVVGVRRRRMPDGLIVVKMKSVGVPGSNSDYRR